MADASTPDTYLGNAIPENIKNQWCRWEGAEWRKQQYNATNRPYPPDERFNVRMPDGMCPAHCEAWLKWRNVHFDPVTGDRWPGTPGSPFVVIGHDLKAVREERRVEWDEKTSHQMQLIEQICLSGRSPQCVPREDSGVSRADGVTK